MGSPHEWNTMPSPPAGMVFYGLAPVTENVLKERFSRMKGVGKSSLEL